MCRTLADGSDRHRHGQADCNHSGYEGCDGIAVATDLGKGFTSNGSKQRRDYLRSEDQQGTGHVKTGANPDSIIYEPVTHRGVFTLMARARMPRVDAKTGEIISARLRCGKPEFCQVDGKGHVYVNMEDKNEIVEINAKDAR